MDAHLERLFAEWWQRLNDDERRHFVDGVRQGRIDDRMVRLLIDRRAPVGPAMAKWENEVGFRPMALGPAEDFVKRQPEYIAE